MLQFFTSFCDSVMNHIHEMGYICILYLLVKLSSFSISNELYRSHPSCSSQKIEKSFWFLFPNFKYAKFPSQSCPLIYPIYFVFTAIIWPDTSFLAWIIVPKCLFQSILYIAMNALYLEHTFDWVIFCSKTFYSWILTYYAA